MHPRRGRCKSVLAAFPLDLTAHFKVSEHVVDVLTVHLNAARRVGMFRGFLFELWGGKSLRMVAQDAEHDAARAAALTCARRQNLPSLLKRSRQFCPVDKTA